jgi:predicted phosphodiesterase
MRIPAQPRLLALVACLVAPAAFDVARADEPHARADRRRREAATETFLTEISQYKGNILLGRPTDRSITLSVLLHEAARVQVAYGFQGQELTLRTDAIAVDAGQPRDIVLGGLKPNAAYQYRVLRAETGEPLLPDGGNGAFTTCRAPGVAFTFAVQADSHLDGNCLTDLYKRSLANVLAEKPDFLVDLGDTFMTGKHQSRAAAAFQYAAQRYYFGLVGHAVPVFLVIGNHDGEETKEKGAADAGGLAVWSCNQRKRLFPNPVPDAFYTGNAEEHPDVGLLQDYYAWTWGDALVVVLDPYWTSRSTRGGKGPWNMTLGKTQYDWLAETLRDSQARHKFVFIHQLTGGLDAGGRGGAEAATLYEWGGHDTGGQNSFAARRPGWDKPVHAILKETGVRIVFHGHDHFFARQELDGIVYQLVPQSAHRNSTKHSAAEYGYKQGDFLPSSGHLRVRVAPEDVTVEYVRAATRDMERRGIANGAVAFRYVVPMRKTGTKGTGTKGRAASGE